MILITTTITTKSKSTKTSGIDIDLRVMKAKFFFVLRAKFLSGSWLYCIQAL